MTKGARTGRTARTSRLRAALGWLGTTRRAGLLSAALLLLMAINYLSVLPQKTITTDEIVHIPAGYGYLARRDFRPNNEHPPLAKLWSALPLLALRPEVPALPTVETPARRTILTGRFFWGVNREQFAALTFWSRAPMIAIALALGALIFAYARRLFGPRAALLAVALYSLEPTVLAHGRFVHTDIPAALALLGFVAALHWYVDGLRGPRNEERRAKSDGASLADMPAPASEVDGRQPRPGRSSLFARRSSLLSLVTGAALATKFSLLVLVPILGAAFLALGWLAPRWGTARWRVARDAVVAGLLVLLVVNAAYLFTDQPLEEIDRTWLYAQVGDSAARVEGVFALLSRIVPTYYLFGAYTVLRHNAEGHPASLLGQQGDHGWWYYFPVAFALKTALPFLLLTLGALGWAGWRVARCRDPRFLALLVPCALYTASTMASNINIGVRHLLPAFPFLFILGGAALDGLLRRAEARPGRRPRAGGIDLARVVPVALVGVILGWMAIGAARTYPDYLESMNALTLGRPGWTLLSDSNVEWGEDVPALARYLRERGETAVTAALAGAPETLQYHGVAYENIFFLPPGEGPATRYVAIGASYLNGSTAPAAPGRPREDRLAEYRSLTPEATFGDSIFLYRVRPRPPQLDAPLAPGDFRAALAAEDLPATIRAGTSTQVRVRVRNTSDRAWPAAPGEAERFQIRLGDRWFDPIGARLVLDDARAPLFFPLHPGEEATLRLTLTAPAAPGDYLLAIDLVQEGVAWFADQGGTPLRARVRVTP